MPQIVIHQPQAMQAPLLRTHEELQELAHAIKERSFFLIEQLLDSNVLARDHHYDQATEFQQAATFCNRLGLVFAQNIVQAGSIDARAERIALTIELAYNLYKQGDFNGAFGVYQALNQSAVSRLKESFSLAFEQKGVKKSFAQLQGVFNPEKNWKALRKSVQKHIGKIFKSPATLPLGPLGRDLRFKWDHLKGQSMTGDQRADEINELLCPYFHLGKKIDGGKAPLFDRVSILSDKELYALSLKQEPALT